MSASRRFAGITRRGVTVRRSIDVVRETVVQQNIGQIVGVIAETIFGEVVGRRGVEAAELLAVDKVNTHESCPQAEPTVIRLP
jgi:hypothetical protein